MQTSEFESLGFLDADNICQQCQNKKFAFGLFHIKLEQF